jgi:hypothetical protein
MHQKIPHLQAVNLCRQLGPFIFFYFGLKVKKDAGDNGLKHATTLSWTFRKIKPAVVDSNGCAN